MSPSREQGGASGRPSSAQEARVLRTMAYLLPGITDEQMDALLGGADALELGPAERSIAYLAPLAAVADPLERARLARAVSDAADELARQAAREAAQTRPWSEIGPALGRSAQGAHAWAHRRPPGQRGRGPLPQPGEAEVGVPDAYYPPPRDDVVEPP